MQGGGTLWLNQVIATNGLQNREGGIGLGAGHTGTVAVQVESGGTLDRGGSPIQGIADQISIAGAVYNNGGTVEVSPGTMLNITATDQTNHSYWQTAGANAQLLLDAGANINAAGTYQIDAGTVRFLAPSGGSADELDGAGLNFGNVNATALTIVDSTFGVPGTVTVQGPVSLAANTTTTMNFSGGNNAADLLDVRNGALTLNGVLSLMSRDGKKPTNPLNFFDDSGTTPSIAGAFSSIKDNLQGTDTGAVIRVNQNLLDYQVTIR